MASSLTGRSFTHVSGKELTKIKGRNSVGKGASAYLLSGTDVIDCTVVKVEGTVVGLTGAGPDGVVPSEIKPPHVSVRLKTRTEIDGKVMKAGTLLIVSPHEVVPQRCAELRYENVGKRMATVLRVRSDYRWLVS
jgi:hypothetical protein